MKTTIGRITSVAGLTDSEREDLAFAMEGRPLAHPNPDDPRWHQVGDAIHQREDGSFYLHRLILGDYGAVGSVKIDITRRQAFKWWHRNFGPMDGEDRADWFKANVPKELKRGLWED